MFLQKLPRRVDLSTVKIKPHLFQKSLVGNPTLRDYMIKVSMRIYSPRPKLVKNNFAHFRGLFCF